MAARRVSFWHRQVEIDRTPPLPPLRLRRVAHIRADRSYDILRHDYPTDRWFAMRTVSGGGEITTHAGGCFALRPGSLIVLRQSALGPFRCVEDSWQLWQWEFWCDGDMPIPVERVLDIPGAANEAQAADQCMLDLADGRRWRLAAATLRFTGLIIGWAAAAAGEGGAEDSRFAPALALMREHLAGDLPIRDMAARCGLGERAFRAAFSSTFGMAPKRFHDRLRMLQAADQLRHTRMPINDIAVGLGYGDRFAFSRVFRRIHGLPPAAYRRSGPS
jgi:AraC-like DNA-binding protein